jgi:uncharacterized protein YqjF (DUF2071 family)
MRIPGRRWVWCQHWDDVLFLHWQVSPGELACHLPAPLEVETFDGLAWVSLVLFRLRVRPRWLPFLPGVSNLLEANLRTYVQLGTAPGIWFLSVHADNRWAMRLARLLTPMPYVPAAMGYQRHGEQFHFETRCPGSPAEGLAVTFAPGPSGGEAAAGTLDAWLLERYRLYIQDRRQRLLHADVTHAPWCTARNVEVSVAGNDLGKAFGLDLSRAPDLAHFSAGVRAGFGAFREAVLAEGPTKIAGAVHDLEPSRVRWLS